MAALGREPGPGQRIGQDIGLGNGHAGRLVPHQGGRRQRLGTRVRIEGDGLVGPHAGLRFFHQHAVHADPATGDEELGIAPRAAQAGGQLLGQALRVFGHRAVTGFRR